MKNCFKILFLGVMCLKLTGSKIFPSTDDEESNGKELSFKELQQKSTQAHSRKRRTAVELLTPNACKPLTHVSQPVDCYNIHQGCPDAESGIYSIQPQGYPQPFEVYCDMDTDGGGWTVFQRRVDGTVNFGLNWTDYKHGFGRLGGEFWLGNEKIYYISTQRDYQLRIDLVSNEGALYYAKYGNFRISEESMLYRLVLGSYSGNAGQDSFSFHKGLNFSTIDRDNDRNNGNCAVSYTAGWWYGERYCYNCNLNTNYYGEGYKSISWKNLPDSRHQILKTEMKIKPRN